MHRCLPPIPPPRPPPSLHIYLDFYILIRSAKYSNNICSSVSIILSNCRPPDSGRLYSSIPRFIPGYPRNPALVLKKFSNLRELRMDLPSAELPISDCYSPASSSILVRWHAHFGSSLDRCLILGAASSSFTVMTGNKRAARADYDSTQDITLRTLGVLWMATSLGAAGSRHYQLHQIIKEHKKLESVVITDVTGQGVLHMDRDQLEEMRKKPVLESSQTPMRTKFPVSCVYQWYAPVIELSGGVVLKGAMLTAIRPKPRSGEKQKDIRLGWIEEEFDGVGDGMYAEAVRMLVKVGRTWYWEKREF